MPAELVVVVERIDARGGDVGVVRQVAGDVEQRIRIAPFVPAEGLEVQQRIDARRRDVRIVRQVVDVVETARVDELGRREWDPPLLRAELQIVPQRIDVRSRNVRIGERYCAGSKLSDNGRPSSQPIASKCTSGLMPCTSGLAER